MEQADAPVQSAVPGYERLPNPQASRGMASSLNVAALAAQGRNVDALLILLADMPFVSAAHLRALLAQSLAHPDQPVFSVAPNGIAQPPALFPSILLPALASLEGDKGARSLSQDAILVECPAAQLFDIDSVDDLAQAALLAPQIST